MEWQRVPPQAGHVSADSTDPQRAHRAALWQQDDVVQQLAVAKYALTVGDTARAMAALDAAIVTARLTLSDLLDLVATSEVATPEPVGYRGKLVRRSATSDAVRQPAPTAETPLR
jgi:hypothetical protein